MQIEITLANADVPRITIAVDPDTYDQIALGAAYELNLRFVAPALEPGDTSRVIRAGQA